MDASARSSIESTLASDDGLLSEKEGTESYIEGGATRTRVSTIILLVPWILCVALLATIVVQARIIRVGCILSEPRWGRRELDVIKREISFSTKQVRFTGGLRWNSTKQLYREIEPLIPDYTGKPTEETEAAWHKLISTTDLFLTDAEVQENIANHGPFANLPHRDDLYTDPYSGLYQAVPTVFHDLHCLDRIRRGIYLEYYPEDNDEKFWPHIEHCLDTIRQSIMCHADMTPIPEVRTDYNPRGGLQPVFQIEHTCRDFEAIQEWAKGRDAIDEKVWRQNAERLKPGVWDQ